MGRSPSSVEAMDVPTPWDSRLERGGAVGIGASGPTVRDGIRLISDADGIGSRVRVADGINPDGINPDGIGVVITGAEGIRMDDAGSGSIGVGTDGIVPEGTGSGAMEAGIVASGIDAWDGINPIPRLCEDVNSVGRGSGIIDADGIRPVTEEITVSWDISTDVIWYLLGNRSNVAVDSAIDAVLSVAAALSELRDDKRYRCI
jgi:hypothetical protein